jgi:hypothetical protein
MVTGATDVKKKYDATRARVLAATALLEEGCTAANLAEEARAVVALIEPPSPTPPLTLVGCASPSDVNYETAVIANIDVQATCNALIFKKNRIL